MSGRLADKVALVTGGAAGLGKAIAGRLAAEGALVVITDVNDETGAASAAAGNWHFLHQDVGDEARWGEVIADIEARFGALHILVNNAGIIGSLHSPSPEDTPFEEWRRVFSVNLDSVFLGSRAAIPAMRRAGGGSIVNISSVAGLLATPYATAYGATKAAVRQLTKSIAQHCAAQRTGIRCNSVHPGNVRTTLWEGRVADTARERGTSSEEILHEYGFGVPMGDLTLPEDVAAAVAFLASDDSRHITGTKLIVDGGLIECDSYYMEAGARYLASTSDALAQNRIGGEA